MTGVLHPARVRRPSNEWLPASDDRNRAHRVACRPYTSEHGKVQHECRLNYRLISNSLDGNIYAPILMGAKFEVPAVASTSSFPGQPRGEIPLMSMSIQNWCRLDAMLSMLCSAYVRGRVAIWR